MKILFVGDIMPGGVLPYKENFISQELLQLLSSYDLRVGTLECAMGDNLPFDEDKMNGKMNIIYSPAAEIKRVVEMGFDVVSLANNHSYDLGAEGLESTISLLDQKGIKHCGAGRNLEEASKPAVVEINGKTIAFLACCQYGSVYIGHLKKATVTESGINPLDIDRCVSDIKHYKQLYDYVFVMPHWGIEYQFLPTPQCLQWAKAMVEAGADGIFASHTHQVQPLIRYKGKPIAFSMGNFLFPDYYMEPPRPIWYPEKGFDDSKIERKRFYPNKISEPCIQVWRHLSRIGMMVECFISSDSIKASVEFVYCAEETNLIDHYNTPGAIKARMEWMGIVTKLPLYNIYYALYHSRFNFFRRGWHFICRYLPKK